MRRVAGTVGTVESIWRYPVKSLGGERLTSVDVEARGLAGDRRWAVRDAEGKVGSGKTTRRFHPATPDLQVLVPTQRTCRSAGGWWLGAVTFP